MISDYGERVVTKCSNGYVNPTIEAGQFKQQLTVPHQQPTEQ